MKLTEVQRLAVRSPNNTLLEACPGSGKTRTIVAKLLRSIEEVRGTTRRVACITYTNAAVDEIEERLGVWGSGDDEDYCQIRTIHTFCLLNVLAPFHWRIPSYGKGFTVLPPESEIYQDLGKKALQSHGVGDEQMELLSQMNREPDGAPIVSPPITAPVALSFWKSLEELGYIDFANIVYYSYRLMSRHAHIVHGLASRFAWLLVDEFQDTSCLQVEILKLISDRHRTKFFLVGDRFQSIYSFAGARPELMDEFARHIGANRDYHLAENWRCSSPIIRHAENLLPRDPPMYSPQSNIAPHILPTHVDTETVFDAMTDHFIPVLDAHKIPYGRAAILASTWYPLYHLGRQLREYGVPVYGIGARPYSRSHRFGLLAEQVCSYIQKPSARKIRHVERELFFLLTEVSKSQCYDVFTYRGRLTVCRLLKAGDELRSTLDSGVQWLEAAADRFSAILLADGFLPSGFAKLFPESVKEIKREMLKKKVDTANLTVDDLGLFADPDENLKLLTIHRAKGREFTAVAIVDLHDNKLPSKYDATPGAVEESRRKLYVALTRAERLLMYVTDRGFRKNAPSRFLREILAPARGAT